MPQNDLVSEYRIAETPLGALITAAGEQVGQAHPDVHQAIIAAMEVMRARGDLGPGRWLLDWDDSYRWHPDSG